ncbi:MAG: pilus (MSHA type) biogenesis protein MshL [Gammaproteobacteria bacterium]|nr:pilus (MSHA type) biogenesis protein MshL [Gammaproteobacteria bacterium]MBU1416509.1 pilus (MSHA type) biogenesis protein MshL [Gammaproteobacteria bacterium]
MTRTLTMTWAVAALLLGGCTSQQFRAGAVHDSIGAELKQAAADRPAAATADKALMPPLAVEMPTAPGGPAAEPRFDLSVVNAPAQQVFMAIVTGTRYNMLVPPDVGGTVTLNLKDVTVREALDAIRELYGYEYAVKGNRITVQSNALQTRIFQINYLASRRQGASELRVTSSSIGSGTPVSGPTASGSSTPQSGQGSGSSLTSRVRTDTDADFWGSLGTALTAIVGNADGRKVVVNSQSGIVVVSALPREIRQVENYLRATQAVVDRQVMLEAKILDVALSQDFQAGINWAAFRSGNNSHSAVGVVAPGSTLNAASGTAATLTNNSVTVTPGQLGSVVATALGNGLTGLALQTSNFAALLNFLEEQGTVTVLSSPRIATINNQKAVLKVGTDELFVTGLTTTTTTAGTSTVTTPTLTLQAYFSGISLDVTPQIDDDNNIVLHIHPAVSEVTEKQKVVDLGDELGVFTLPLASSSVNESDSIVRVRDGAIVAIGGLMAQSQTQDRAQVPGLGNVPGAGYLFGQRAHSSSKRELVILLKPTVIASDSAWLRDLDGTSERIRNLDPRGFMNGDR